VSIYTVTIKATRQQHTTVDISSIGDRHACSGLELCSLPVSMPVYMPDDCRGSAYSAGGGGGSGWPACLRCCCCRVNVTLFLRVTLIREPQSTSDLLDHFHPRALPCSRVKSRDNPISGRRGDSAVPYSFIYRDSLQHLFL